MHKTKEPVKLREKKLKNGGSSLYLDIYLQGQRRYEFLGLYLKHESTKADRDQNRETLRMAQAVRNKRQMELQAERLNIATGAIDVPLFDYIAMKDDDVNVASMSNYLRAYEKNERITLRSLTPMWCRGFRSFLDKQSLKPNSKANYFVEFNVILNKAVQEGLIPRNPAAGVTGFSREQTKRVYLSVEEVRAIANTRTGNDEVRRAFVFSCLTGMRFSDVKALCWGDVEKHGKMTRVVFTQQKTKGLEYLDIAPQAVELMGEREADERRVFVGLTNTTSANNALEKLRKEAGINKHISFHTARHTHATMLLSLGVDIYTVSKLLGHRSVVTTQIYAKIMDKAKQEAVSRIPRILSEQT